MTYPIEHGLTGAHHTAPLAMEPAALTMSSREIADLCDKQHQHVRRDIDAMCNGLEINASSFGRIYRDARNRQQTEYHLPKDLTLTLVAGYNVRLRKRIIDRWMQLEDRAADPATLLDNPAALRGLLLTYTEKVTSLEARVDDMRGDVAAHERLTKADGSLNITETAKNLGMRPKDLFQWLSHNGWIYRRPNSATWLGYQTRCNQGLLEHKTTTVQRADGTEKITEQVRVTPRGLSKLARVIHPTAQLVV